MAYMAKAEYRENERGVLQLQDAGLDLNMGSGGLAEHAKDAILFCCAVMILSLLYQYFWLLLLLLPGRILQLLWVNILAPWIFDPNQGPQVNEKKQQKLERKMRRIGICLRDVVPLVALDPPAVLLLPSSSEVRACDLMHNSSVIEL
ncbi:hypothetical protein AHF37_04848 [Paragonimus kellicotti]|nr:hypothetical protein AHF37_04848 [Paragonimus kellicotti]